MLLVRLCICVFVRLCVRYPRARIYKADLLNFWHETYLWWYKKNPYFKFSKNPTWPLVMLTTALYCYVYYILLYGMVAAWRPPFDICSLNYTFIIYIYIIKWPCIQMGPCKVVGILYKYIQVHVYIQLQQHRDEYFIK